MAPGRPAGCPEAFRPTLVLHCASAVASRVAEFVQHPALWPRGPPADFTATPIPNTKYPELVFLKTSHPLPLLHALWSHDVAMRFLHAAFPVDGIAPTLGDVVATLQARLVAGGPLRLHVYPPHHKPAVLAALEADDAIALDPRQFQHVLMLLQAFGRWYFALLPHTDWRHSEAAARCDLHKSLNVCSAQWKLHETFERLRITLPKGFRALDVGASPGGWTSFLGNLDDRFLQSDAAAPPDVRSDDVSIVAVDPAELKVNLGTLRHKAVHLPLQLQGALEQLAGYAPFDIVVIDANIDLCYVIDIARLLAGLLGPRGWYVQTLKFLKPQEVRNAPEVLEQLRGLFDDVQEMWLLSNSTRERTVVGRGKASTAIP